MDRLGYDALWLAEHHFQPEGYECLPNILMVAVHLAHVTEPFGSAAASTLTRYRQSSLAGSCATRAGSW